MDFLAVWETPCFITTLFSVLKSKTLTNNQKFKNYLTSFSFNNHIGVHNFVEIFFFLIRNWR